MQRPAVTMTSCHSVLDNSTAVQWVARIHPTLCYVMFHGYDLVMGTTWLVYELARRNVTWVRSLNNKSRACTSRPRNGSILLICIAVFTA